MLNIKAKHPPCPYCHGPVEPRQTKAACDSCMAWHHKECWEEHGSCSACAFSEPPLVAPGPDLSTDDVSEIREALRLGNPSAAQRLCLDLHSDERVAQRLYEALLDEARRAGWIASARAENARVIEALAEGRVSEAQALCMSLADDDEERALELYEYLLARTREQGLAPKETE